MDVAIRVIAPGVHPLGTGIVGSQGVLQLAIVFFQQVPQIARAQLDIDLRIEQHAGIEAAHPRFTRQLLAHGRQQLHQADGIGRGNRAGIEF